MYKNLSKLNSKKKNPIRNLAKYLDTFHWTGYKDGKQAHENMFNIINH